jgi:hypothetical protein
MDGYPEGEAVATKAQPWRNLWEGPKPSTDGRLLIALPRRTDFGTCTCSALLHYGLTRLVGSNNLGGY